MCYHLDYAKTDPLCAPGRFGGSAHDLWTEPDALCPEVVAGAPLEAWKVPDL